MIDDLGPAELRPLVLDIIARMPDARNPTEEDYPSVCLYTDPDDPSRHCIAGQLAASEGWRVPGPNVLSGACAVADDYGWPLSAEATVALRRVQAAADSGVRSWGSPEVRAAIEAMA